MRPRSRQRLPLLIEDLDPVVPAVADENSSPRVDSDGVESMELARRPTGFAPRLDELSVLRKLHDAVVAVVVVPVGDEDVAVRRHGDVAWRTEVIGPATGLSGCAQRHQHLAVRAELDDLLPAFVALGRPVLGDCVRHPDIAVAIHVEPMRPDEHSAAEALHDLAVRTELDDRIRPGVAAFVAEPRWILQPIASHDRPDVSTVGIDHDLADGAHRPAVRQLRPAFDEAIRIRKDLRGDRRSATQRSDENERDHQPESQRASHTAPRGRDYT